MVSSAIRGVVQTFVAMALFGDIISTNRWTGIFLTVMGSCLYTYVRFHEGKRENAFEPVKTEETKA